MKFSPLSLPSPKWGKGEANYFIIFGQTINSRVFSFVENYLSILSRMMMGWEKGLLATRCNKFGVSFPMQMSVRHIRKGGRGRGIWYLLIKASLLNATSMRERWIESDVYFSISGDRLFNKNL